MPLLLLPAGAHAGWTYYTDNSPHGHPPTIPFHVGLCSDIGQYSTLLHGVSEKKYEGQWNDIPHKRRLMIETFNLEAAK